MFLDHFYIISVTFIVFRGFGKWNICECSSFATTVTDGKNIFHFFSLKINVNRNKKNNLWSPLVSNFLKASSTCNFHVIFFKLILAFFWLMPIGFFWPSYPFILLYFCPFLNFFINLEIIQRRLFNKLNKQISYYFLKFEEFDNFGKWSLYVTSCFLQNIHIHRLEIQRCIILFF